MAAAHRARYCKRRPPAAIRSADWFGNPISVCASLRNSPVFSRTLAVDELVVIAEKAVQVPNVYRISGVGVLLQILDEGVIIIKDHPVRCAAATVEPVLQRRIGLALSSTCLITSSLRSSVIFSPSVDHW